MWSTCVDRSRGCFLGRGALVGGLLLVCLARGPAALAQAPVDPAAGLRAGAPVNTAYILDRNPQVGGGGYNYIRPVSPLLGGNLIASGMASGGLSLRNVSPIADPSAFRAPLGSGALSAFRRDSVSIASVPLGSGTYAAPFYDPSTTVPTVGMLSGLAGVRAADSGSSGPLDLRVQTRLDSQGGLASQIVGLSTPASISPLEGQASPFALPSSATSSSIFGAQAPPRLMLPTETQLPWRRWSSDDALVRGVGRWGDGAEGSGLEEGLPGVSEILATPLGGALGSGQYPRWGPIFPPTDTSSEDEPAAPLSPRDMTSVAMPPAAPVAVDARLLPGFDVFTDMRLAVALMSSPDTTWFEEMRRALRQRPELAREVGAQAAEDAAEFVDRMLHTPLRSLTGAGSSALNDQLLKAESLMGIGHYSEAVDRYDAAHMIDPENPLPLIGKGHALLAQGNYLSAAAALLRGIELADHYPGMALLLVERIDLEALMGGGEIIDIRRADMMRQLERQESAELRFLLGYLEYHSGSRERGLENLTRAARNPRAGMMIGRYPALLESGPAGPPSDRRRLPGEGGAPGTPLEGGSSAEPATEPAGELVVPPRTE